MSTTEEESDVNNNHGEEASELCLSEVDSDDMEPPTKEALHYDGVTLDDTEYRICSERLSFSAVDTSDDTKKPCKEEFRFDGFTSADTKPPICLNFNAFQTSLLRTMSATEEIDINDNDHMEPCFSEVNGDDVEQPAPKQEKFRLDGVTLGDMEHRINVELAKPKPVRVEYNVSYTVHVKDSDEKKVLLERAAGEADPGDIMAIMGPSGAGKTTLLSVLAGRKTTYRGSVLFNGEPMNESIETDYTLFSFVQQEDLFITSMTPREHLLFSARLRVDRKISTEDKKSRVEALISELGLTKCADTPIGGAACIVNGRISGGERKRLSLATEILSNPSVIFVDEPTSGLDSFMAEAVVAKLGRLARVGHTVLATIHQPSSYVFSAFTKLHLLSNGKTAYSGPASAAVDYFRSIGHPLPPLLNPADYYLKLLSTYDLSEEVLEKWEEHVASKEGNSHGAGRSKMRRASTVRLLVSKREFAASWCTQLHQLMKRTMLTYRRNATIGRMRLVQAVIVGVLVGLIFLSLGRSPISLDNAQSVNGALFFGVLDQGILGTLGVLQVFPQEKPVFLRECASNNYSSSAYFMGKTLAEFPIQVVFPFVSSFLLYFMVGFGGRGADVFCTFSLFITLTAMSSVSLGYFVGAISPSVTIALAVGPLFLMPLIVFGGLLINVNDIKPWFVWLSYLSFFRYGFEGVMIVIWEEEEIGDFVLDSFGWDVDHKWRNVGCLCALIVGFRCLAMVALKYQTVDKSKLP